MKKDEFGNLFVGQRVWVINKNLAGTIYAIHNQYGKPAVDIMLDPHRIFKNGKHMYLASPRNLNVSPFIEGQTIRVNGDYTGVITNVRPSVNGRFWYTTKLADGREMNFPSHECEIEAVTRPIFNNISKPLIPYPAPKPNWKSKLTLKKDGRVESTISNHVLILENDDRLAGKIAFNRLRRTEDVVGQLPWHKDSAYTVWDDTDAGCLRVYLDKEYGIGRTGLNVAFSVSVNRYSFHPVQDSIKFEPV